MIGSTKIPSQASSGSVAARTALDSKKGVEKRNTEREDGDADGAATRKKARSDKDTSEADARRQKALEAAAKWRHEAPLSLSDDRSVLSVGHAKYDVSKMLDDMVSSNVIAEGDKDFVDMASLVSAVVSPGRTVDTSPLYPEATINFSGATTRARVAFFAPLRYPTIGSTSSLAPPLVGKRARAKAKEEKVARVRGGGGGGRGAGRAGAVGALSLVVAADAAPAPPPSAGHAWQHAVSAQVTALTGSPFKGFQAAGAAHALTFLTLMAVMQGPHAPDVAVVGDRSGKITQRLLQRGEKVLAIDPLDSPLPGLRYKGLAEDVLPQFHFGAVYSFLPCDDDAMAGSQYFQDKVYGSKAGLTYWSLFLNVCVWCTDADAVFLEHPKTLLGKWRAPSQILQPYFFGVDDEGDPERKTTPVWLRGWRRLVAKYVYEHKVHDKRHALLIHDAAERSKRRSELSWSFATAIVNGCNSSTIVAGAQRPVLADDLRLLDA